MNRPAVVGTIANGRSPERDPHDFYETPPGFTQAMLKHVPLEGRIWEPTAGAGAIVDVLRAAGHQVRGTDINPRRPEFDQLDVFDASEPWDGDIVLNPPFRHTATMIPHLLKLARRRVVFVGPLSVLNSSKRHHAIWGLGHCRRIVFNGRYQVIRSERGDIPSQFTHCWIELDRQHQGNAEFIFDEDIQYRPDV